MANDLRIRLLGRPQIENDSASGFQKITRKYAVEGPKVSQIGLSGNDDGIALFREVGEPDEEFNDHYLVSQVLTPGESIDSAILTRVYVQLRDTWYSEQTSESGDLKRMTRKYVALRNSSHTLAQLGTPEIFGYSTNSWSLHPVNGVELKDSSDGWDKLPQLVLATEPNAVSYADGDQVGTIVADPPPAVEKTPRRIVFPRVVKVLSNVNGNVELEVQGAAPWKLGGQEFSKEDGKVLEDAEQTFDVDEEFVCLVDPRSATSLDDPASYDASDPYTDGLGSLVVGQTITLSEDNIKPVIPNMPSVNAQTDDGYIVENFDDTQRKSSFIEDLALYENNILSNTIPQTEEEASTISPNLYWVRASVSVDTSQAGLDVWSVSWVAPVTAHWRTGGSSSGSSRLPTIVAFDHHGLHTFKGISNRKGGTAVFVYYTIQEQVPINSSSYSKNSGSVSLDFKIQGLDGNNATSTFKQSFSNAAFYRTTQAHLRFPMYKDKGMNSPSGDTIVVACSSGGGCSHYGAGWVLNQNANIGRHLYFFWEGDKELPEGDHPMFQGKPVQSFGGSITYDATTWDSAIMISPSSFKVTPIHTHNTLKIWKIEVTYF